MLSNAIDVIKIVVSHLTTADIGFTFTHQHCQYSNRVIYTAHMATTKKEKKSKISTHFFQEKIFKKKRKN